MELFYAKVTFVQSCENVLVVHHVHAVTQCTMHNAYRYFTSTYVCSTYVLEI